MDKYGLVAHYEGGGSLWIESLGPNTAAGFIMDYLPQMDESSSPRVESVEIVRWDVFEERRT